MGSKGEQKEDEEEFHDAETGLEDAEKEATQAQKDREDAKEATTGAASLARPAGWEGVVGVRQEDWIYWNAIIAFLQPKGNEKLAKTVGRFYNEEAKVLPEYTPVKGKFDPTKTKERQSTWDGIFMKLRKRFPVTKDRTLTSTLVISKGRIRDEVSIGDALDALQDAFFYLIRTGKPPTSQGSIRTVPEPVAGVSRYLGVLNQLISADLAMERLARGFDDIDGIHFLDPTSWWVVLALQADSKRGRPKEIIATPSSDFLTAIGAELDM